MPNTITWYVMMFCWGAFVLIWVTGWLYNLVRAPQAQKRSPYQPVWIIGAGLVLLAMRLGWVKALDLSAAFPLWLQVVGLVLLIPSAALAFWARFTLGVMWSDRPETKVNHQLRTEGPYAVTRHPIYTGTIGMLLGSLLVSGAVYWILLALVGISVVLFKLPQEEKLMLETFGDQYRQYRRHVPRILPGLRFFQHQS